ncbi:MAG: serine hydrolase, partial [Bacteroidota bacterium]
VSCGEHDEGARADRTRSAGRGWALCPRRFARARQRLPLDPRWLALPDQRGRRHGALRTPREPVPLRTLAERMVTHSSNLATNLLIAHVGADSVQATIERLGTTTMRVLRGVEDIPAYRAGLSNTATAHDLAQLMSALMDGRAVGPEADAAMVEILLDQRHNEMIPARLPSDTRVAHKTGWITRIHHDAAIVYPEPDASSQAPYVLVILTEGIDDYDASAALGASIAGAVHAAFRPTTPS